MIFGLKRKHASDDPAEREEREIVEETAGEPDDQADAEAAEIAEDEADTDAAEAEAYGDDAEDETGSGDDDDAEDEAEEDDDPDPDADEVAADLRADGPFDISEVDLGADSIARIDLGSLVVTPFEGFGLQLQVNEQTRQAQSLTAIWQKSGLEVALFAAPASGGLAAELREDLLEEAEQAGGNAQLVEGPFGTEVRRVLPQEGPDGQQLFHVARIWFAEGPRWLLRASLLGEAALGEIEDPKAAPFLEFFRNLVVRRGSKPMVPGELIAMDLPQGKEA